MVFASTALEAQWGENRFDRYDFRTAREAPSHSTGTPEWALDPGFEKDVFTFVRVRYNSPRWQNWITDFPDSDLNFSFRLQQMTSLKVDPNTRVIELTDPDLSDYPWIYIVEPGYLQFTEEEVPILRKYLLNGGFLMLDDFWGEREYANIAEEMKRVFPERDPIELSIDHPVFNCVFTITKKPQVPNVRLGIASEFNGGITWERPDAKNPDYRAIYDDKNRMMVIFCHNTDDGDGWEREGESEYYFREFSEKQAYPLGINIIFYSMTH